MRAFLLLLGLATSSLAVAEDLAPPAVPAIETALRDLDEHPLPGRAVAQEIATLRALYAGAADRPLWIGATGPTAQSQQLIDILQSARDYGLEPADYAVDELAAASARLGSPTGTPAPDSAQFDLMLTRAAIRLVTHLHYGRIDPHAAGFELPEPRHDLDVAAAAVALSRADRVSGVLAGFEPHFHHYGLLKLALARYRALAADPSLTDLPAPGRRTLHAGDAYAGAAALRRLLTAVGDLPASSAEEPPAARLDAPLAAALTQFERRHGLNAAGSLGALAFAALTTPLSQRVRQIELTLERWRWLPPFDRPPIIVNIPEFRLFAFHTLDDRVAAIMSMNVIVGQSYPRTQTPIFTGELRYLVFRPYWDIPRSILLREMLPAITKDPGFLARKHLEIVRGESDSGTVLPPSPAAIAALADGSVRLRQRPGEDNALGLVKFMFPNVHDVYLHSTPAQELFLQSRRAFSHGCIRVSDPVGLALYVLRNDPGEWGEERIVAAMHGADAQRVNLPYSIPVMILYGTAQATEAGPIEFFADIYGHDAKLQALLAVH
jgi:murein L,D-transpeptidase YcbB/YkuD